MNEWTLAVLPYALAPALAALYLLARPLGRRLAPLYAHSLGGVWLLLTWLVAGTGVWAAFKVSQRSIVVAIALVLIAPLAAGLAVLAYRDARRGP